VGPGADSYYEYLLKGYLLSGHTRLLDAFVELYAGVEAHLSSAGVAAGGRSAFISDVDAGNGKLASPWVSSLGAFWPALQATAGQAAAAAAAHANFTAVWRSHGALPESFSLDGGRRLGDPGYNLRPEHGESNYVLWRETREPALLDHADALLAALGAARARCGYAALANVTSGARADLQESFLLAETLKYLFLTFVTADSAQGLEDFYVLSTEGHPLPVLHPDGAGTAQADAEPAPPAPGAAPPTCAAAGADAAAPRLPAAAAVAGGRRAAAPPPLRRLRRSGRSPGGAAAAHR